MNMNSFISFLQKGVLAEIIPLITLPCKQWSVVFFLQVGGHCLANQKAKIFVKKTCISKCKERNSCWNKYSRKAHNLWYQNEPTYLYLLVYHPLMRPIQQGNVLVFSCGILGPNFQLLIFAETGSLMQIGTD